MASFRGVVGRASEFSIILLLESADTSARKITLCVLESGRSLPAPFPLYSLRIRRRWSSTSNSHQCRQVELGVVRSERFCLLAKVGPYSVHALHQVGAREAQVKSDGGVIPAVYHPPLQQNPVRLCQISEQRATSAALHVLRIPLNPVSMLHADQDLATRPAGTGGPSGFSPRGRRTPKRVLGAGGSLEVVAAAGVLVRHIALAWKGTSLALPAHSRPRDPPRVVQGQQNPRKPLDRPNSCARTRSGEESGYWESVPVGGGDYKRPVRQQGVDYLRAWTEETI